MFAAIGYKKKLQLLGISIVPVLVLCYQLSVKKTVEEYEKYQQVAGQTEQAGQMGQPGQRMASMSALASRQARVEGLYNRFVLDTFAADRNLLAIASNYCRSNDLTLKEYRTISVARIDSLQVLTRVVTVEGRFIPGLKMIYELEAKRNAGRVSCAVFGTVVDHQDKSTRLDCTLYVQNLIP
jgi:hypothetical protein